MGGRMISTKHTQSLTQFRQKANQTLDRLNKTGDAEILTVNGQARAVLLSPARFDELARDAQLSRDAAVMRTAIQQIEQGQGQEAGEFLDELRAQLMTMKGQQARSRRPAGRGSKR